MYISKSRINTVSAVLDSTLSLWKCYGALWSTTERGGLDPDLRMYEFKQVQYDLRFQVKFGGFVVRLAS